MIRATETGLLRVDESGAASRILEGPHDAVATGAVLPLAVQLLPGHATAGATVAGDLAGIAAYSLTPGAAYTGSAVIGAVLPFGIAVSPGEAQGTGRYRITEDGATARITEDGARRITQESFADVAAGDLIITGYSLAAGTAHGGGIATGTVLPALTYSLAAIGYATGTAHYRITEDGAAARITEDGQARITEPALYAVAAGELLSLLYSLEAGTGYVGVIAVGAAFPVPYALLAGAASGGFAAVAPGAALQVEYALDAGRALGVVGGAGLPITYALEPGEALIGVAAAGAQLSFGYALAAGRATGERSGRSPWRYYPHEIRAARAPGALLRVDYFLTPGKAQGDRNVAAVAAGTSLNVAVTLAFGTATGQRVVLTAGYISVSATVSGAVFHVKHSITTDENTRIDNDFLLTEPLDIDECDRDLLFAA